MSEDIEYCPAVSIYTDNGEYAVAASSPCHKPCADMEGMKETDPAKRERAIYLLGKLREKHGLNKPAPPRQFKKLEGKEKQRFLSRLKQRSLRLQNRVVERHQSNETA